MNRLIRLKRIMLIGWIFSTPLGLFGWVLLGKWGGVLGFATGALGLLAVGLFSERGLGRVFRCTSKIPEGLSRSLEFAARTVDDHPRPLPHLMIFPDPLPRALVVRSVGSQGRILVSQGLLALLNEAELRSVLRDCIYRSREREVAFQSFCSMLAILVLYLAPRRWVRALFRGEKGKSLTPLSALRFLALFPLARFLLNCGRLSGKSDGLSQRGGRPSIASQKISQSLQIWTPGQLGDFYTLLSSYLGS